MASLNKVSLIGNLGRDPEIRSFSNGGKVCNLNIATSESWKDKDGNRQERTEWHNVVIHSDGLVGVADRYLRKGSKVYIEGSLRTRKWTDKDGADRYTTEIVVGGFGGTLIMLDGKPEGRREPDGSRGHSSHDDAGTFADELDDTVPFLRSDSVW